MLYLWASRLLLITDFRQILYSVVMLGAAVIWAAVFGWLKLPDTKGLVGLKKKKFRCFQPLFLQVSFGSHPTFGTLFAQVLGRGDGLTVRQCSVYFPRVSSLTL